jgi:putative hydrolase of HD superfamily
LEDLLDFITAVGRLKRLPRTGWVDSGVEDPESVADHSFRTTFITMVLADLQGLDSERAMRIALLHDLAEAEMGDLTPEQKRSMGQEYIKEERGAIGRILSRLPEDIAEDYHALWEEFIRGSSPEAEIVAQADKLEMILQALEYEEEGVDPVRLNRFWHTDVGEGLPAELARAMMRKKRDVDV